jgi:hypothetical protein
LHELDFGAVREAWDQAMSIIARLTGGGMVD